MTVTESRPEPATELASDAADEAVDPFAAPGLAGALGTGDHKTIGRMYVLFGLVGGLLALVLNLLVALERTDISGLDILTFGSDNQFFQVWSLSRTSLVFFCVMPLLIGLATHIVPLQVGAPSIAFPRAAATAFWAWVVGFGIHATTVFVDGGLGYPLWGGANQGPDIEATELSLLSIALVVLALLLASVCILTTVIAQRPQGMTLFEVPLFSWSMLVAGGVWMLTLPVWLANVAIAWVDFRGADSLRYGDVREIWHQVDWLWSQPMVFAFAIPVFGIIGDIVPVSAGTRQPGYGIQQAAIAAFGAFSFGAFAQPYFNPGVSQQLLYVLLGLLIVVPILAFAGGVGAVLKNGKLTFSGHFALAILALLTLLAAAGAAALSVAGPAIGVLREFDDSWAKKLIDPLEDLQGTVITSGVMIHVLMAGLIGAVAGLVFWAPKIFGRTLNPAAAVLAGLALVGGTLLSGVANIVNGFLDEGEEVFNLTGGPDDAYFGVWDGDAVELFNVIGAAGAVLLIAGLGLVLLNVLLFGLFIKPDDSTDLADPWNGHTLEWAGDSPPPSGNFSDAPAEVTSERPLLDLKEADA